MFKIHPSIAKSAKELEVKAQEIPPDYRANLRLLDYQEKTGDMSGINQEDPIPVTPEQKQRLIKLYWDCQRTELIDKHFEGVGTILAAEYIQILEDKLAYWRDHPALD